MVNLVRSKPKKANKFDIVAERLQTAKGITWDTCHKIYVLMDSEQVKEMKSYDYDIISADLLPPEKLLTIVRYWYRQSCGLRFINAVSTVPEGTDPNEGFETLIEQG